MENEQYRNPSNESPDRATSNGRSKLLSLNGLPRAAGLLAIGLLWLSVTQADIVSNKRLADVVQKIQAKQRKRDEEQLANKSVTLRRKKQIRTARAQADGLPESS
jgi:hypothetical protein